MAESWQNPYTPGPAPIPPALTGRDELLAQFHGYLRAQAAGGRMHTVMPRTPISMERAERRNDRRIKRRPRRRPVGCRPSWGSVADAAPELRADAVLLEEALEDEGAAGPGEALRQHRSQGGVGVDIPIS